MGGSTGTVVKNHDQRTSIWRFYNISIKRPQTTPISNRNSPCCDAMHKRTKPGASGGIKIKIRALAALFCGKSHSEKFDEADTNQSGNSMRFSAILHANAFICSVYAVGQAPGPPV
jgi:hypothetical protein